MNKLTNSESEITFTTTQTVWQQIEEIARHLPIEYKIKHIDNDNVSDSFIVNIKRKLNVTDPKKFWDEINGSITGEKLYEIYDHKLGTVLEALGHFRITKADLDRRGTQLKFLLTLEVSKLIFVAFSLNVVGC